ncbi:MAG TPA: hypothetical protein VGW10_18945 [Solirubrobacteraceae bacterium]|nr:hypothetical protein [Solirubrobacteraceae bacterium]
MTALVAGVGCASGAAAVLLEPRPHDDERMISQLRRAYDTAPGGRIAATELYEGSWNRLQVFAPLTPHRVVAAVSGRVDGLDEPGGDPPRPHALAVFLDGRSVVAAVEVDRAAVDVTCLDTAGRLASTDELEVVAAPRGASAPLLARQADSDCEL